MSPLSINRHDAMWLAYIGSGIAFDLWRESKQDESTLSSRARLRFQTRAGRVLFLGGWLGLTGWVVPHITIAHVTAEPEVVLSPPS